MSRISLTQSLQKWGNSAGVRLPKKIIDEAHLKLNQPLNITVQGKSVVITPIETQRRVTLDAMLKDVTPEDVGGEYDWGGPLGKEIW